MSYLSYLYSVSGYNPNGALEHFTCSTQIDAIDLIEELKDDGYTDVILEEIRYY